MEKDIHLSSQEEPSALGVIQGEDGTMGENSSIKTICGKKRREMERHQVIGGTV